jgi:hypothetical protein
MSPGQLDRSANGCTTPDFGTNDNDATNGNETTISPMPTTTHHKDIHPNISSVLGTGPGFMDQFNTNPHAEKRSRNVRATLAQTPPEGIVLSEDVDVSQVGCPSQTLRNEGTLAV